MIYRYAVNHNGVWYPAGAEVPKDTISVMDTKDIEAVEQEEPVKEEPVVQEVVEAPRTRTDVNRMTKAVMLALAESCGISVSEALTVNELRRKLLKHYGL